MRPIFIIGVLVVTLLVGACNSNGNAKQNKESLTTAEKNSGKLFIIGGGKRPPELIRKLIEISALDRGAYAIILPMASEEPDSAVIYAKKQFTELGIPSKKVIGYDFQDKSASGAQLDSLENAGLIYICGGDQNRFMDKVLDSPIFDALKKAYQHGATIAGTSAGAAVMSEKMISGAEFKHPEYTGDFRTIEANNIELKKGLGFLNNVIIDQHFIQRMRMNRLISTAIENPDDLSIGIDESTAILVENDSATVVGESQVILLKNKTGGKTVKNGLLGSNNLDLSIILPGEKFAIKN